MKQSNRARVRECLRGALLSIAAVCLLSVGALQAQPARASVKPVDRNRSTVAVVSACPVGRFCSFIPVIINLPSGDLVISGVEVTQAVQNPQNSLPLVAGRSTMLRILTYAYNYKQAVGNVKISVQASTSNNAPLSGSPQAISATIPLSSSRANYASTINIPLPATWLSGTVNVTVKINSDNRIVESNLNNNTLTQRLVFNPVPPLRVMIVPVRYHNTGNGRTYPAPGQDSISEWIMRTYPINQIQISWHTPHDFTGNLTTSSDFGKLLNEITTLKSTEGAPASVAYYGLVPTSDGSSNWFSGGIAGLGWVGSRAAVGLDVKGQASQLAAHELGHNLGMSHTPCGGPASPDPNFPYSDGTIGQYGLDVSTGILYPPTTKDVMGYCDPKWVSDYTYRKLYTSQVQSGAVAQAFIGAAASQRSLLVRANIYPDGVEMLPAYVLSGSVTEAPEPGEYEVQVLGNQGETLVQAPVRAYTVGEDGDIQMEGINAMIALPGQPAAGVRLLKDGHVLAEQVLVEKIAAQAKASGVRVERAGGGYRLRWDAGAQPALVRYSPDGGRTWTTLGVDVKGSEINVALTALPDPNGMIQVIQAGDWQ